MKTKAQKTQELEEGRQMLEKSKAVLLVDFGQVKTADMRNLRQELKQANSPLLVIKKRLLGLLLKEKGVELPGGEFKAPMAAVFADNMEAAAASVYKFFKGLEMEKKIDGVKIMGGVDVEKKQMIPLEMVLAIGKLPAREVLLGQLLGMLAAPIRSFLYVLDQRAKQTS